LRRDFKRFAHNQHKSLSVVGRNLLCIINEVFALHRAHQPQQIKELFYLRRLRRVEKKMLYYLNLVPTLQECNQARRVVHGTFNYKVQYFEL
jgi:hypothetical protein